MKANYLMVTKWQGAHIIEHHNWQLIRRVEATGNKARQLGIAYAKQLNNGIDLQNDKQALINVLNNNSVHYSVCAIPDNQAREYHNYESWENSPLFNG